MGTPCPSCRAPLESRDLDGLALLLCPAHGVFLAPGQLEGIRQRAAAESRRGWQARKRAAARAGEAEDGDWVARIHEIRRGKRRNRMPEPEPPPADPLPCPRCGAAMGIEVSKDAFRATPDVAYLTCPEHGSWLTHRALDILVQRAREDAERVTRSKVRRARWEGHDPEPSGGGCGGCGG